MTIITFILKVSPSLQKLTYGNLANAYFVLKDDSRSIEAADKAMTFIGENASKSDAKYFYRRAVAKARQQTSVSGMKDYGSALQDIKKAHALNSGDSLILNALTDIKAKHKISRKSHARIISRSMDNST